MFLVSQVQSNLATESFHYKIQQCWEEVEYPRRHVGWHTPREASGSFQRKNSIVIVNFWLNWAWQTYLIQEKMLSQCSQRWGGKEPATMTGGVPREWLSLAHLCFFWFVYVLSCIWLFATPGTVAHQASLSMGTFRREYWSGLPFPSPGNLPDPGIEPWVSYIAERFFTHWAMREKPTYQQHRQYWHGIQIWESDNIRSSSPGIHVCACVVSENPWYCILIRELVYFTI